MSPTSKTNLSRKNRRVGKKMAKRGIRARSRTSGQLSFSQSGHINSSLPIQLAAFLSCSEAISITRHNPNPWFNLFFPGTEQQFACSSYALPILQNPRESITRARCCCSYYVYYCLSKIHQQKTSPIVCKTKQKAYANLRCSEMFRDVPPPCSSTIRDHTTKTGGSEMGFQQHPATDEIFEF